MYKELISMLTAGNQWVKIGEPATETQIQEAEQEIGFPFPEELKALLRELNGDGWALMSLEEMLRRVRINREVFLPLFESDFSLEEYENRVNRFIFFGTNGCGDDYGYRVSPTGQVETTEVYIWEHEEIGESCCWKKVADNLEHFITRYYNNEI